MLNGKEPKIVNGPEILNKYVGQSEENVRALFAEAEAELALKGDDSELHIIIFDEIDSVCKQRGSSRDGTGVGDTVVNQLVRRGWVGLLRLSRPLFCAAFIYFAHALSFPFPPPRS